VAPPRFSIVTPVYNPPLAALKACIDSVRSQTVTDWEWCIVDDCSTQNGAVELVQYAADLDQRIRFHRRPVNGGIVAASNDALGMASGEFVGFLDHDDRLLPDALERMAQAIEATTDVDYLYSDETHVFADGREAAHFPKPDWCPERFRASMYTCHLSLLRRDVVTEIGGFRAGYDGSQDHDLILRATELISARGRHIVHVPQVLYHWRHVSSSVSRETSTLTRAVANGRQAVEDQCTRLGIDARVVHGPFAGTYRLVRNISPTARATVVVPTRGETGTVVTAVSADHPLAAAATLDHLATAQPTAQSTTAAAMRLVVAYPDSLPAALISRLDASAGDTCEPVRIAGPWSIASALDQAFTAYPGDVLVCVAPGLVARPDLTPDWLETLIGLALTPGVGLVGALIATPDDAVVHGGWDDPHYRLYALEGLPVGVATAGNDLLIERECTHVSLAAAAISAAHWREFRHCAGPGLGRPGSFDAAGRNLSTALLASGARTIWTPYARFDEVVPLHR
jgi:hypothetical protein